jgi:hypothetical protein
MNVTVPLVSGEANMDASSGQPDIAVLDVGGMYDRVHQLRTALLNHY